MRVVGSVVLLLVLATSTRARADLPVVCTTEDRVSPLGDEWWKWPVGLGAFGGVAGAAAGAGATTVWIYSMPAMRGECDDCETIFQPWAWAILYGVPAAVLGGTIGAIAGAVIGTTIAFPEEPPAPPLVEPSPPAPAMEVRRQP